MALTISSPAFPHGTHIPARFTCQGDGFSPALNWGGAPDNTVSFVVLLEDPDAPAGIFTHWILFNVPGNVRSLPEGASPGGRRPAGSHEGRNSAGGTGYNAPCPPFGPAHRYYFRIFALSNMLDLKSGADREQVLGDMKGVILAQSELMGMYRRS
jgi:Raf kinase inhibitor-like YbhB/YbcL family protein